MGYCCRNDISLLPRSHHTAKQTGPDDEALNNQRELSAEMGIHFPGLKTLTSRWCGYLQSLWSVWIVAPRNLLCRKLNCAYLQKTTPLRQDSLELILLSLTISLRIDG